MKARTVTISLMALAAVLLSGCHAYYGKESQHTKGDWYGFAGSGEVSRIKSDKLAFDKLQTAPVQTLVTNGVPQGYRGVVANLSNYQRYNFRIYGPETKSWLLGPGERATDYLVPGRYTCVVTRGISQVGQWTFHVGVQQSTFMNEKYHWYVYTER